MGPTDQRRGCAVKSDASHPVLLGRSHGVGSRVDPPQEVAMAIYPCDVSRHRYAQPQQAAYISVVQGMDARTYRLRLCPTHFSAIRVAAQKHLLAVDEDTASSNDCTNCGIPRDSIIFARLFPRGGQEQAFAADLCAHCGEDAVAALVPFEMEPLPAR